MIGSGDGLAEVGCALGEAGESRLGVGEGAAVRGAVVVVTGDGRALVGVGDGVGRPVVGAVVGDSDTEGVGLGGGVDPQNGGTQVGPVEDGLGVGVCALGAWVSSSVARAPRSSVSAASTSPLAIQLTAVRDTSPPPATLLAWGATDDQTYASDPT